MLESAGCCSKTSASFTRKCFGIFKKFSYELTNFLLVFLKKSKIYMINIKKT